MIWRRNNETKPARAARPDGGFHELRDRRGILANEKLNYYVPSLGGMRNTLPT